jgi:hypothetical protein
MQDRARLNAIIRYGWIDRSRTRPSLKTAAAAASSALSIALARRGWAAPDSEIWISQSRARVP